MSLFFTNFVSIFGALRLGCMFSALKRVFKMYVPTSSYPQRTNRFFGHNQSGKTNDEQSKFNFGVLRGGGASKSSRQ